MTRLACATAGALLPLLGGAAAFAQSVPTGTAGSAGFSPPVHGGGAALPRRPQEPPGLPGSAARPGETAPPVQTALAPTEALFDAINRGDMTEARDAVSRGADVNAPNALGLTPIDLSIDLSRNDITFLLLSVRGQDNGARSTRLRALQATAVGRRPPTAAAPTARYAGNGGAPNPQAGFLGFGGAGQP